MKNLTTFILITLFLMFVVLACGKPELHKQFIIEKPGFRLVSSGQLPKDEQSTRLFKIGERKEEPLSDPGNKPSDENVTSEESSTIKSPTETFDLQPSAVPLPPDENNNNYPQSPSNNSRPEPQPTPIGDISAEDFETLIKQVEEMFGGSGFEFWDNKGRGNINDARYREEIIAWNVWHSTLQNTIMQKSYIRGAYGTTYYFAFDVDNKKRITSIQVTSTQPNDFENKSVIKFVIQNLEGKDILTFPRGTARKSVRFSGGFMLSNEMKYSSPSDYSDYEHVKSR